MYSEDGDEQSKAEYWKGIKKSLIRYTPIAIISGLILIPDKSIGVVVYSCGIILLFFLLAHIVRKQLFPYVKLEELLSIAIQSPVGAAVCFSAICYLLAAIFTAAIGLIS